MPDFEPHALTFEPHIEERIWGGRALERFGKPLPPGKRYGESWEISDVEGRPTRVAAGPRRGSTLRGLVEAHGLALIGRPLDRFPLLLKLLDAAEDLSVQVHPSDEDLRRQGLPPEGKTESWIILEAGPGARIIHGLSPGVDRTALLDRLETLGGGPLEPEEVERLFRWVPVAPGDVIHVPAGTIHAIGRGIVLLEIQQTSDVTYRVHDWGRAGADGRPRALHLRESRDVSDPGAGAAPCPVARLGDLRPVPRFETLIACEKFRVECLTFGAAGGCPAAEASTAGGGSFHVLAGVEGSSRYRAAGGDAVEIGPGTCALLPATRGAYRLETADPVARLLRFRL